MTRSIGFLIILPVLLIPSSGFATEVDVFVEKTADHVSGDPGDGGAVHTRARVSASANLYRSDGRPPTVTTRAWIWSFPERFDPAARLRPVQGEDPSGTAIFAWVDDDQRVSFLDQSGVRVLELPEIQSVPGMMSRWSADSDGRWAVAVTPKVLGDTVVARPHIQRTGTESSEGVVRSLPAVHLSGGQSRLTRIPAGAEDTEGLYLLELQSYFGWEGTPPKVRQQTYTDSWTDRIDIGGQLEMKGVYTNGSPPYTGPR